jgi:hypothetical protein
MNCDKAALALSNENFKNFSGMIEKNPIRISAMVLGFKIK